MGRLASGPMRHRGVAVDALEVVEPPLDVRRGANAVGHVGVAANAVVLDDGDGFRFHRSRVTVRKILPLEVRGNESTL